MKIYVVRHGETTWNKEEVFRGRKDIPLNDTGLWQAERTGAFFSDKGVSAIYSSPLSRARQTASRIGEASRVPVTVDDAFTDMDFGPWEGLSLVTVEERFPQALDTWRNRPHQFRVAGAETLARVRKRVEKRLREAVTDGLTNGPADGPVVVIVTHRVICKLLVLHFLGVSNRFFWKIKCDPASITFAEQTGEDYTLSMVNQTLQLQDRAVCREYRDF
ncbi:MAG TPA: histidine phosphatase family protein [Syntrophorhabdales bacterium]|nr:histidine phosphatase family protein [Syntrophorhabdales bacterium]